MTVRLIAVMVALASGATERADLPPGAVLRLADDRLFHGSASLPAVAFTADGRSVLIGVRDGTDHYELPRLTPGRPRMDLLGMLPPDGRWTVASSEAGRLTVADAATGKAVWTEAVDAPSFYQFTADGQTLLVLEVPAGAP